LRAGRPLAIALEVGAERRLHRTETMNQTTTDLKNELEKSLTLLRTLRDEVRVKLHLAGMDAKDQWKQLEPRLAEVEEVAAQVTEASRAAVVDAVTRLKKFRDSLN
jgi:hypothetical protein